MRKIAFVLFVGYILISCGNTKKNIATASTPAADTPTVNTATKAKEVVSYAKNIAPILKASCTPCHFPNEGGRKVALDNYDGVKAEINDIIRSVKLPKDANGFMPFKNKKPALTDSAINVLVTWQKSGMAQ